MQLMELSLQAFKCFDREATVPLATQPGLYFVTGENHHNAALEGNGVGKSTLLDAITWCLYGKTLRKAKATAISAWGSRRTTQVTLTFTGQSGHPIRLRRTWNPNSLRWAAADADWQEVAQEAVEAELGLGYDAFVNSVIFGQFNRAFLDLTPAEKDSLFASLLALDEWDALSEHAKSRVRFREEMLGDVRRSKAEAEGGLQQLDATDIDSRLAAWEQRRQEKLAAYAQQHDTIVAALEALRTTARTADSTHRTCQHALALVDQEHAEVDAQERQLLASLADINELTATVKASAKPLIQLLERLATIQRSDSRECPYCGSPVTAAHIEQEVARATRALEEMESDEEVLRAERAEVEEVLTQVRVAKRRLLERVDKARRAQREAERSVLRVKEEVKGKTRELRQVAALRRVEEEEENPFVAEQQQLERRKCALRKVITEYEQEIARADGALEVERYWVKGFKSVRLMLLSDMLAALELEVNNALFRLGLVEWKVAFVTEQETAKTVRKSFQAVVYSPHNDGPVAWEAWSGGESQRLRLATSLGLASLILLRAGVVASTQWFDEPSTWLSERGIASLLDVLAERAGEEQKAIFLVDHRHLDAVQFAGVYNVIREQSGSRVNVQ